MKALLIRYLKWNVKHVFRLKPNSFSFRAYAELLFNPPKFFLYVGDSHAVHIADKIPQPYNSFQDKSRYCYPLGPRLMHSIAISGFKLPKKINYIFRLSEFKVLIVVAGEIDCRMYLGGKDSELLKAGDWPELFLKESVKLGKKLGIKHLLILTPVPPSDLSLENTSYPRRGKLSSRVAATNWLSDRIIASPIFQDPKYKYLDVRPILANSEGSLSTSLTDDGVHVNSAGAKIIRESISKMYSLESSGLNGLVS